MDRNAILDAFTEQVRRHPAPDTPGDLVEHGEYVTRHISPHGWTGITWSDLDADTADAVIADEIDRFAALGGSWEWKHYNTDRPADLPDRLRAAGFVAEPAETVLVAEIADLGVDVRPPEGVRLVPVGGRAEVDALVSVHDAVFGGNHAAKGKALLAGLAAVPPTVAGMVAFAGDTPIAEGRVEFHHGTDFAGLCGGATVPAWRGRGVFRALVAARAALAADQGFRYLQVDATEDSRPILGRLGFIELATTTPFLQRP